MGDIFLKTKEARRLSIMEQVVHGLVTVSKASEVLGLSRRHVFRLAAGLASSGAGSLAHRGRGRPSPRATAASIRARVVKLAQEDYKDASYAHLSDLLAEYEQITLSSKTVGRILKAAGVPPACTRRDGKRYRRRERKSQSGVLVQADASPFDWLELGADLQCLHGIVDDAGGDLVGLYMTENECTEGYLRAVGQMARRRGLPNQIYTDRHTIFVSPKKDKLSVDEELRGQEVRLTQFGRAISQLGVGHILAHSPQAKGRIERVWGTLQQRLPIELRIRGIKTIEKANAYLYDFCCSYNEKFAVGPSNPKSAWRPKPDRLDDIVCLQHERKTCAGSTISFEGNQYQLVKGGRVAALKSATPVLVRVHLDGRKAAEAQGQQFSLQPFKAAPKAPLVSDSGQVKDKQRTDKGSCKPAANHPWRKWQTDAGKQEHERMTFSLSQNGHNR